MAEQGGLRGHIPKWNVSYAGGVERESQGPGLVQPGHAAAALHSDSAVAFGQESYHVPRRLPVPSAAGSAPLALSPTLGSTDARQPCPHSADHAERRCMRGSWLTTRLTLVLCLGAALAQAQPAEPARTNEVTAGAPPASAPRSTAEAQGSSSPESPRERARSLGYSGVRAYGAGDYAAAHEQLEQAFSLLPVPSLGLWSARTLVKLNRWVDAERRYREVARLHVEADAPAVQLQAQATVQQELLALLPRIPTLRVRIEGARPEDVVVSLDGVDLPAERWTRGEPIDPGPHSISGTDHVAGTQVSGIQGGERSTIEITAVEGREREVLLRFTPAPLAAPAAVPEVIASAPGTPSATVSLPSTEEPSSARTQRLVGWIGVGAGVAGLTLSGVSYFVARSQKQQLTCNSQGCEAGSRLDAYNRMRTLNVVSLVAGGVFGAVGVGLLLFEPEPDQGASSSGQVAVRLGLGSAELVGSF